MLLRRSNSLQEHYDSVKGLLCGIIAASSSGVLLSLIKVLLLISNITVFELIYQRSLCALLLVTAILWWKKVSFMNVDREVFKYTVVRSLGSAMGFICMVFSLELIPISKSIILIYNPFITAIITYLCIGEKISKHDLISFLACTVGVGILTNPFSNEIHDFKELVGILFAFMSSLSFNISYVALRHIRSRPVDSWIIVFFIMVSNCVAMPAFFLTYDAYKN